MTRLASLVVLLGCWGCGDNSEVNLPPLLVAPKLVISMPEDGVTAINASAEDPEGRSLTYSVTQPLHGTLSGGGPGYTYTPARDYAGPDTFTVSISDGVNTLEVPVDITITAVDDAPVAAGVSAATHEGQDVAITLPASDIDSAALTYSIVAAPLHGTLSGTPPLLTYTPEALYHGADSFTFQVSDGILGSNVASAMIEIAALPD